MPDDVKPDVPQDDDAWKEKIDSAIEEKAANDADKDPVVESDADTTTEPEVEVVVEQEEAPKPTPPVREDGVVVNPNKNDDLDPEKAMDAKYLMSMTNTTPIENAKTVGDALSAKNISGDSKRAIFSDKDHYINRLLQIDGNSSNSMQSIFATEAMARSKDATQLKISDRDKTSRGKQTYGAELSGKQAVMAFTSRVKGIKKVYLYNSGIYVCLRPMDLSELDSFYTEVDHDGQELGRIVGGLMFLIHDMHLKAKFTELIQSIVVDSNLIGWDKKKVLIDNISIQDLDTLYWAVCSMMHKNGIKVDLVCGHEDCKHITPSQLMDINRMRIVDPSGMSQEALKILISDEPIKSDDLKKYRASLLDVQNTFTNNHMKFELKVPTIGEVLRYNKDLMAEIVGNSNEEYTINNEKINRSIMINYNRNFTPWIAKVSYIADNGQVEFSCTDVSGIHAALALNDDSEDEGVIMQKVSDFIRETKLSHVGYAVLSCEKCGRSSTDEINGYKAWDAQGLFTSLTYLKLGLIGMA